MNAGTLALLHFNSDGPRLFTSMWEYMQPLRKSINCCKLVMEN